jgi:hypothetical protein
MRWFSKIATQKDALASIQATSSVFLGLGGLQVGASVLLMILGAQGNAYVSVPTSSLDVMVIGVVVIVLACALRYLRSRVAATTLLLVSILTITIWLVNAGANPSGTKAPAGNLYLSIVAIGVAIRAMQATFALHGRLAETAPPIPTAASSTGPKPTADFISHPQGGVESTAAAASMNQGPKQYDREKWAALLKYDDELAIVAGRISPLGERWLDEFAHAYLTLNDKKYLQKIEDKIFADARAEAARSRL